MVVDMSMGVVREKMVVEGKEGAGQAVSGANFMTIDTRSASAGNIGDDDDLVQGRRARRRKHSRYRG